MMSEPLVSIIVPVYNSEPYLEQCLLSILGQTYFNIEIICVDDGSNDGSLDILKKYQERDERIKVIKQNHSYAGVARNNGMSHAKGAYLCFLDSDDYFEEHMIEKLVSSATKNNAEIVICGSRKYDNEIGYYDELDGALNVELLPGKNPFSCRDVKDNIFQLTAGWAWDKLYDAEFVKNKKILFQDIRLANDELFVDIAYSEAERITAVRECLVTHRANVSGSIETTRHQNWQCGIEMLFAEKDELLRRGKYEIFKKSFINRAAKYLVWYAYSIRGYKSYKAFFIEMQGKIIDELGFLSSIHQDDYIDSFYYDELALIKRCGLDEYFMHVIETMSRDKKNMLKTKAETQLCLEKNQQHYTDLINAKIWPFQYNAFEKWKKVVVYGYGKVGKDFVAQLKSNRYLNLVAVVDKYPEKYNDIEIKSVESIKGLVFDYVVIAVLKKAVADEIRENLLSMGVKEERIVWYDLLKH